MQLARQVRIRSVHDGDCAILSGIVIAILYKLKMNQSVTTIPTGTSSILLLMVVIADANLYQLCSL